MKENTQYLALPGLFHLMLYSLVPPINKWQDFFAPFCLNNTSLHICATFSLFIHLFLGWFCILALVNSAIINVGMQVFLWYSDFTSLVTYPEEWWLGCLTVLFSVFWGTSMQFSIAVVLTYIPPVLHGVLFSLHSHQHLFFICFL